MSKRKKSEETLKVSIVSGRLTINLQGVGRTVALSVIASLTFLVAWYIYIAF